MKMSTEGLIALIGHEAIVLSRYRDTRGVWTIGVGHTKEAGGLDPESFADRLSLPEAVELLRTDIARYESEVRDAVSVPLQQHEFDALVSFHYNTGAIARATLTETLNAGNRVLAGEQFLNWLKPPAIRRRREAEHALFLTGAYPAPLATLYPADGEGRVLWAEGIQVDTRAILSMAANGGAAA
ncbi:lysozyme [Rhizobiaceae bacterium n13]|uniref:Lysozyme n=1 Tax=Ferirhizobium litorale TaxID=2927786 RepID=A0AAE3U1E2_9HYPH|nr:lysozyme [Fererhizobium litorale]MDI7863216.1 lysozyme [Fererhizobium litorale]MDI7923049.1 lysozyme [Fererhizobium litorale]